MFVGTSCIGRGYSATMTRKVFWEDPYLTELDTRVATVDGDVVTLDDTIFFAFAGGQESDRGTIGGRDVVEAKKDGLAIRYTLAPGHGLAPGDAVRVAIDGARRRKLMRLHFAAELVLELVTRKLDGIEKIGAHIAEDKARIDFRWPESLAPHFAELTAAVNEIVARDQPIITAFDDEANERRYWELDGLARVPCGGTHCRRTGEIGTIELRRNNIGKGKERIEIRLSSAA
jgi:Ser-tRNA(Ala) deacylase AlaX